MSWIWHKIKSRGHNSYFILFLLHNHSILLSLRHYVVQVFFVTLRSNSFRKRDFGSLFANTSNVILNVILLRGMLYGVIVISWSPVFLLGKSRDGSWSDGLSIFRYWLFRSSVFAVIKILSNVFSWFFRLSVIVVNLSEVIFEFDSFNFSNAKPFLANNPKIQIPIKRANLEDNKFILFANRKYSLKTKTHAMHFPYLEVTIQLNLAGIWSMLPVSFVVIV